MITPTGKQPAEGANQEVLSDEQPCSPQRYWPLISHRLVLALLLTCGGTGVLLAQPSDNLDHGQAIYRQHCMECHGATGRGDGVKAPFLSPRPGNLISAATSVKTDSELLRTIAQGKPRTAMPAWQEILPAEDRQAVLQYIRSLVRFTRPLTIPPAGP